MFQYYLIVTEELINKGLVTESSNGLICVLCGYSKTAFSKIKRHFEGKHSIGDGYPCPLCNKIFKTENGRQMHIKNSHKRSYTQAELKLMAVKLKMHAEN